MSHYRKINVAIHNDSKFASLSDKAKLLFFTLLTHPNLTSIGAMRFTQAGMAEEMGWTLKDFQEAFREVLNKGMIWADEKAHFLCLPNFLKHNKPESPNVVKSWSKLDGLLPECQLKNKYYQVVKGFLKGFGKAFGEAFREAFGEDFGKAMPNQELELEQELEYDNARSQVIELASKLEDNKKTMCPDLTARTPVAENSDDWFESQFWPLYPSRNGKKRGKAIARKIYQEVRKQKDWPGEDTVLAALQAQIEHKRWCDQEGKFCEAFPDPERWLKKKRWQDEISLSQPRAPCQPARYPEPDGLLTPDPNCEICRGFGLAPEGPCKCLHPVEKHERQNN